MGVGIRQPAPVNEDAAGRGEKLNDHLNGSSSAKPWQELSTGTIIRLLLIDSGSLGEQTAYPDHYSTTLPRSESPGPTTVGGLMIKSEENHNCTHRFMKC